MSFLRGAPTAEGNVANVKLIRSAENKKDPGEEQSTHEETREKEIHISLSLTLSIDGVFVTS